MVELLPSRVLAWRRPAVHTVVRTRTSVAADRKTGCWIQGNRWPPPKAPALVRRGNPSPTLTSRILPLPLGRCASASNHFEEGCEKSGDIRRLNDFGAGTDIKNLLRAFSRIAPGERYVLIGNEGQLNSSGNRTRTSSFTSIRAASTPSVVTRLSFANPPFEPRRVSHAPSLGALPRLRSLCRHAARHQQHPLSQRRGLAPARTGAPPHAGARGCAGPVRVRASEAIQLGRHRAACSSNLQGCHATTLTSALPRGFPAMLWSC